MSNDYVSDLQNFLQRKYKKTIKIGWQTDKIGGSAHNPTWTAKIIVGREELTGSEAVNVKIAKQNAARDYMIKHSIIEEPKERSTEIKNTSFPKKCKGNFTNDAVFVDMENLPHFLSKYEKHTPSWDRKPKIICGVISNNHSLSRKTNEYSSSIVVINSSSANAADTAMIMLIDRFCKKYPDVNLWIATNDKNFSSGLVDCITDKNFTAFTARVEVVNYWIDFVNKYNSFY